MKYMNRHIHLYHIRSTYYSLLKQGLSIFILISLFVPQVLVFAQDNMTEIPSTDSLSVDFSVSPIDESTQIQTSSEQIINSPVDTILKEDPIEETTPQSKPEEEPTLETSEDPSLTGENPFPQKEQSKTQIKPEIDQTTGALSYSYPFNLPEGRAGHTPSLSLIYNSQETSNDSITGYGWNLSIPSIKRFNKYGVDKLYDPLTETFVSSLDGELVKITNTNTYRPKVDNGTYHLYTYTNNTWSVTTKEGTTYAFGTTSQSRQDDPSDATRVYAWNVETITDSTNNTINYTYTKDQGQIYPSNINYAIFNVDLTLENRTDQIQISTTSFPITLSKRIKDIRIKESSTQKNTYTLNYIAGDNGTTSQIQNIQLKDNLQAVLDTTSFQYGLSDHEWNYESSFNFPTKTNVPIGTPGQNVHEVGINYTYTYQGGQFYDINGDGLLDIIYAPGSYYSNQSGIQNPDEKGKVWLNDGTTWVFTPSYNFPTKTNVPIGTPGQNVHEVGINYTYTYQGGQFYDINGDGLLDIIYAPGSYYSNQSGIQNPDEKGKVWLNDGTTWVFTPSYNFPTKTNVPIGTPGQNVHEVGINYTYTYQGGQFYDINGDGLLDIIYAPGSYYSNQSGIQNPDEKGKVWLNDGTTWVFTPSYNFPTKTNVPIGTPGQNVHEVGINYTYTYQGGQFYDINGDGLLDIIYAPGSYYSNQSGIQNPDEKGKVWLNDGTTWVFTPSYNFPTKTNVPIGTPGQNVHEVGINYTYTYQGGQFYDINGDGLLDIIYAPGSYYSNQSGIQNPDEKGKVWLNDGTTWVFTPSYNFPTKTNVPIGTPGQNVHEVGINYTYTYQGGQFYDINGDGLLDIIYAPGSYYSNQSGIQNPDEKGKVWLNDGTTWVFTPSYNFPTKTNVPIGTPGQNVHEVGINYTYTYQGGQFYDINGDGLLDIIYAPGSYYSNQSGIQNPDEKGKVWLNDGTTWVFTPSYNFPTKTNVPIGTPGQNVHEVGINYTYTYQGGQFYDINGDGLLDIIYAPGSYYSNQSGIQNPDEKGKVWLNDGTTWVFTPSYNFPTKTNVPIGTPGQNVHEVGINYTYTYQGGQFYDINGDGLLDIIYAPGSYYSNQSGIQNPDEKGKVWLNDGTTWVFTPSYNFPTKTNVPIGTPGQNVHEVGINYTYTYQGGQFYDINGDGLLDIIYAPGSYYSNQSGIQNPDEKGKVWLNDGTTWVFTPSYNFPTKTNVPIGTPGQNVHEVGINYTYTYQGGQFYDINGDGLLDIIYAPGSYYSNQSGIQNPDEKGKVWLNDGTTFTNLLTKITTQSGMVTEVKYKNTRVTNKGGDQMRVVGSVTTSAPFNSNVTRSDYTYSGGEYFYTGPHDKKFAGFEKVQEKIYDNNTNTLMKEVVTYFHQGDLDNLMPNTNAPLTALGEEPDTRSKIGKVFRTEIYDGGGVLQEKTMTRWGQSQTVPGSFRVYPTSTLTQNYDGATHTDTGHIYTYTLQGNLATDTDFGIVTGQNNGSFGDIGTDKRVSTFTYVVSANGKIYKPLKINIRNHANVLEKETKYQYDNLSSGVTTGLLTREDVWKSGTGVTATYATTKYAYNPQGLMTSKIDPNGNTTTYAYGSTNLYPSSVTEPQNMVTTYLYNNSLGKITQMTDPNNRTWKWTYDALGRTLTEQIPHDSNPTTQITKTTYVYNDIPTLNNPAYVRKTSNGPTTNEYTLLDGFGRPIRILTQTGGASYAVTDTTYDPLGRTLTTSLPFSYVSSPTTYTGVLAPSNLQTSYTYDGQDRVLSAADVHGTTTYTYAGLTKTVTDALGNQKKYTTDVFGNLVEVREKIGATWYPTSYTYNTQNNLTKITDALGNIRNFTYDALGRRIVAEDLHAPSDLNFGTYAYTYDDNGNLLTTVTPEGDTIVYTYDTRNRVLTEKLASDSLPRITYTYDQGTDGKGRLTSIAQSNGMTTTFTYTASGKKRTETISIPGSTPQLFSYGYDVQGSNTRVTYPDLSQTITTVSYRNLPTQVQYQAGGTSTNLASSVTYNPMGQVVSYSRTNGIVTTNTYDANQGYRLTKRVSQKAGQPKIQDISYTYDAVGNITTLLDNSVSATKKTASYTYDDLYRLTSATVTNTAVGQAPYTETFTYNPIGNITSKNGTVYSYTIPNKVNPHAPTSIGGQTLTYSDNGNLLTDGLHTNIYNYKNELSTTTSNSITSNFTYNHEGQRVKKVTNTSEIYSPTPFYTQENTKKTKTVLLGDLNLGTIETDTILGSTTHTPRYAITDHLGSIEKTTGPTAQIISTLDYYPYGSTRIDTGGTPERTYIGERYDPESGYNYLNARYYNGAIGKFISQDPVFRAIGNEAEIQEKTGFNMSALLSDPQQLNSYSYARNNPIRYSDPTGNLSWDALLNSPVDSIQHVMGWGVASLGVNAINRPFTADLLRHSASLNPGDVSIDSGNQKQYGNVIDSIKGTSQYQGFVNQAIENAKNGQNTTSGSLQFDKGDLYTSLHRANIQVGVEQTKDGWATNTTISDRYDFNPTNSQTYKGTVTRIPATQAYKDQQTGVLSNYNVKIKISDKIKK
jgi:RHS repeat-associated protein